MNAIMTEPTIPLLTPSEISHQEPEIVPQDGTSVHYGVENGTVLTGVEINNPGAIDWKSIPEAFSHDRQIVIHTESGNTMYVAGNLVVDLNASNESGTIEEFELQENDELPFAIGEPWTMDSSDTHTGKWQQSITHDPVTQIDVRGDRVPLDNLNPDSEEREPDDPFINAQVKLAEIIDNLQSDASAPQPQVEAEKFRPDQSFVSWFRKNRAPELKKLLVAGKIGKLMIAASAVGVDYAFSTYDLGPNLSQNYQTKVETPTTVPKEQQSEATTEVIDQPKQPIAQRVTKVVKATGGSVRAKAQTSKEKVSKTSEYSIQQAGYLGQIAIERLLAIGQEGGALNRAKKKMGSAARGAVRSTLSKVRQPKNS